MFSRIVLLGVVAVGLGGCGYIFPGFEGVLGINSYIHDIPVSRITTELQCEMADFLHNSRFAAALDPDQPSTVSIKFQADQSGTFQYIGIDLSKIGLSSLANLISVSNKSPSLQAKLQEKTTTSAQLDMSIPQSLDTHYVKGKFGIDPNTGKIDRSPSAKINGLERVKCDPARRMVASLSLSSWLDRFFEKQTGDEAFFGKNTEFVCMSKITLSTQIVLIGDVSAGVNPFIGTAFIIPVSGESFDFNPSATQNLNIVLSLKKLGDSDLCTKLPQPQPSRTI